MSRSKALLLALCLPLLAGAHWTESIDANVASGLRAFQSGDFVNAVAEFRQALAGEGARTALHFDLGTALVSLSSQRLTTRDRQQDLDLAIVSLRSARAKPGSSLRVSVDYNLGNALLLRGRFSEAVSAYRAVLMQDPEHDDARHNLELALLALHAEEAGQKDRLRRLRKGFAPDALATAEGLGAPGQGDSKSPGIDGLPAESPTGPAGTSAQDGGVAESEGKGQETAEHGDPSSPSQGDATGDASESGADRDQSEDPGDAAPSSLPPSGSTLSLQKKLDALERRSAELRRASMLRKTTRRLRDPDKPGVDR